MKWVNIGSGYGLPAGQLIQQQDITRINAVLLSIEPLRKKRSDTVIKYTNAMSKNSLKMSSENFGHFVHIAMYLQIWHLYAISRDIHIRKTDVVVFGFLISKGIVVGHRDICLWLMLRVLIWWWLEWVRTIYISCKLCPVRNFRLMFWDHFY